jgi:hypothetical protein
MASTKYQMPCLSMHHDACVYQFDGSYAEQVPVSISP